MPPPSFHPAEDALTQGERRRFWPVPVFFRIVINIALAPGVVNSLVHSLSIDDSSDLVKACGMIKE
jgi:hypothetical protein